MKNSSRNSRRSFLQRSAAAAVLGSGALSLNGKIGLVGSALAARSDYATLTDHKALVCVYLSGGCDTFGLLPPATAGRFKSYSAARGPLAVKKEDILYAGNGPNRTGFNKALPGLHRLYGRGDLAIVQNVGNLLAPVSRLDYISRRPWLPPDLFMHDHQQALLLQASSRVSPVRLSSGWGARMADLLEQTNGNDNLPHAFSLSGNNQWLAGTSLSPLSISPDGLPVLEYLDRTSDDTGNEARRATLDKILALRRQHLLKQQAATGFTGAADASRHLNSVLDRNYSGARGSDTGVLAESLAGSLAGSLAESLQMVAKLVADHQALEMKRQVFFVRHDGWDTHTNQPIRLAALMRELDDGLAGFQRTLREQGQENAVTTFTASEFGRSLAINSGGTDHGWGGHCLVMGGAVSGGRLYGLAPSWQIDGNDDAGNRGRFIPSTSINQLGAVLAGWFGLNQADVLEVFPDLDYFSNSRHLDLFGA